MPQPQTETKNKTSAPEKNSADEETKQNALKPEAQPRENQGEPEEEKTEEEKSSLSGVTNFLSPEAMLMLGVAFVVDVIGWILILLDLCGLPIDDLGILDIIGLVIFGFWIIFRKTVLGVGTGQVAGTQKSQKAIKKVGGKILKRWGLAFLVELIPVVGNIAPCWTIAVYYEIKNG